MPRVGQHYLRGLQRWCHSGQFTAADFADDRQAKGSVIFGEVHAGIRPVPSDQSLRSAIRPRAEGMIVDDCDSVKILLNSIYEYQIVQIDNATVCNSMQQ